MKNGIEAVKATQKLIKKVREPCPHCGRKFVDLGIARVPKPTLEVFKKLAFEENCNDYGFTLKFLLDFYMGRVIDGSAIAEAKAEEALSQCAQLASEKSKPEENTVTMCDGSKRRIK